MANSDSIQLALRVIQEINSAKQSIRSNAQSYQTMLAKIDAIMVEPAKKAILLDGLSGLSVDAVALKAEKDALVSVIDYTLNNIPALTK